MKYKNPKLITAERLSHKIAKELCPSSLFYREFDLFEDREKGRALSDLLMDSSLHISVHQSAADEWSRLCRKNEPTVLQRRFAIYRAELTPLGEGPPTFSPERAFNLAISDREFSLIMIALDRTGFTSRNIPPEIDVVGNDLSAFWDLFNRLRLLPERPSVMLDRRYPGHDQII